MGDDLTRRRDEAKILLAIFGDSFLELSENEWRFQYREPDSGKVVACYLPEDYPSCSAPVLVLEAHGNRIQQKQLAPGKEVGLGRLFFRIL